MTNRNVICALGIVVVVLCLTSLTGTALAQTRLFVPQAQLGADQDTQLLASNGNDKDAVLDIWAFSSNGELVGQYQMTIRPHGTRALLVSEAFGEAAKGWSGWIAAVSNNDGIQLSYSRAAENVEWLEAQDWTSREITLNVDTSEKSLVRFTNPNLFAASVNVTGTDKTGKFVGTQSFRIGPYQDLQVASSSILGGEVARVSVASDADIVAVVDDKQEKAAFVRNRKGLDETEFALMIEAPESLGAYQVTLNFDPESVQFSAKDVLAGTIDGFDSKPLVVNIDNAAGQMTIGSFQVGASPRGRMTVARLRVLRQSERAPRFGLKVDEVSNTTGDSLVGSGLSVGLVRIR